MLATEGQKKVRNEVRIDAPMMLNNRAWSFLSLEERAKVSLIEISLFFLTDSPFIMAAECS